MLITQFNNSLNLVDFDIFECNQTVIPIPFFNIYFEFFFH